MKKRLILLFITILSVMIVTGCSNQTDEPQPIDPPAEIETSYMDISADDAWQMIGDMPEIVILDVSPLYEKGHIPGAVNYYVGDGSLDEAIPMFDMEKTYLVYCHNDAASTLGAQKLIDAGFEKVYRLEGNYSGWINAGYPYVTEHGYIDISPVLAKEMIDNMPEIIIVDVSPLYDRGHIPGAVNYYVGDGSLDAAIPMLDMEKTYLVYCHNDAASMLGAQKLIDAEFEKIYRLEGNYSGWVDAGFEVEMNTQ